MEKRISVTGESQNKAFRQQMVSQYAAHSALRCGVGGGRGAPPQLPFPEKTTTIRPSLSLSGRLAPDADAGDALHPNNVAFM